MGAGIRKMHIDESLYEIGNLSLISMALSMKALRLCCSKAFGHPVLSKAHGISAAVDRIIH